MLVCLVSSYPPRRCGIAAYTEALVHGLRSDDAGLGEPPVVLCERAPGALPTNVIEPSGVVRVLPSFHRSEDYVLAVAARASALGADVVHVQHSADIFGADERLPRLLSLLRGRGIRSVVTLHTVHSAATALLERRPGVVRFQRRVGELADAVIVHGFRAMADELLRQRIAGPKIHVVPHGTEVIEEPSRDEARERLCIPRRTKLVLNFGFVHPQKSVHTALLAMRHLLPRCPDALLWVAGAVQNPGVVNRAYSAWLARLARRPCVRARVRLTPGFTDATRARLLFRAADVVLLPYCEGYGSASGVAHQAVGAGSLPLCSRSPKFAEIADGVDPSLIVQSRSSREWARAMLALLEHDERRVVLTERARGYARETEWGKVGAMHARVYRGVLGIREGVGLLSSEGMGEASEGLGVGSRQGVGERVAAV